MAGLVQNNSFNNRFPQPDQITMHNDLVEKCAKICERPWWRLAPGMIDIKNEPIPFGAHPSQGEVFSFINDIMVIRAQEIRGLLAQEGE